MPLLSILSILFILFFLVLFIIIMFWLSLTNQSPYYPTEINKLKKLIDNGEIIITKNTRFIDIGSGDGRVVELISKYNPEYAHGVDINPFLTLASKFLFFLKRRKNVKIYNKNFFNHNFTGYNFIYSFIFTESISKLINKLIDEVEPGTILVSNTFTISNLTPYKIVDGFNFYKLK